MKKVTVSAPGKIHLSGEHAVVHGNPAIIVSVSKRLYVTLGPAKPGKQSEPLISLGKKDPFVRAITSVFTNRLGVKLTDIPVNITSDIPKGVGMGSSAALSVSLIAALLLYYEFPWDPQLINELACQAEKFKHTNSSGSDTAVATHGGMLWYRRELDFLKIFWLLPLKIPATFSPFILINTGRSETTGDLVETVAALRRQNEQAFIMMLHDVDMITKRMATSIRDENESAFRKAIAENERLLERMSVLSEHTKTLIRSIEQAGGVAKISGAGGIKTGSGIVLATHSNSMALVKIAKKYGYPFFTVVLGGEGVRREQVVV